MGFWSSVAKIGGIVAAPFTGGASLGVTAAAMQKDAADKAAKAQQAANSGGGSWWDSAGSFLGDNFGTIVGALGSYFGQQSTNQQNTALSEKQMAFQEAMSSTAHQREVKDLTKAGLNPVLSAGGGGSSTPSGSMPQVQNPLAASLSTALQLQQQKNANQSNRAQVRLLDEQGKKTAWDAVTSAADAKIATIEAMTAAKMSPAERISWLRAKNAGGVIGSALDVKSLLTPRSRR